MTLTAIGFDADDRLWHNEHFFQHTQAHLAALLAVTWMPPVWKLPHLGLWPG